MYSATHLLTTVKDNKCSRSIKKLFKINFRSYFSNKILHYLASFSDSLLHMKLFDLNIHIDIASHQQIPCCLYYNVDRLVDVMSSNSHSIRELACDDLNYPIEKI